MAQPEGRRTGPRAASVLSTAPLDTPLASYDAKLPPHYLFPPTVPSPFTGSLEASLDAILEFARIYPELRELTTLLLKDVDGKTEWPFLISKVLATIDNARELLEELLFLVTRTLLPEQVAENRALMYRMYSAKRNLSMRITLRYDMIHEWQKRDHSHYILVESRAPLSPPVLPPAPVYNSQRPDRPPFLPNIWSTLVAAPAPGGYTTRKMCDAMRHHVTELDKLLLLTDEEVRAWNGRRLLFGVASAVTQWQWLRENTETLGNIEVNMWEELDVRADECEWVKDTRNHE